MVSAAFGRRGHILDVEDCKLIVRGRRICKARLNLFDSCKLSVVLNSGRLFDPVRMEEARVLHKRKFVLVCLLLGSLFPLRSDLDFLCEF